MNRGSSKIALKTTNLSQNDILQHVLELEKGFIKNDNQAQLSVSQSQPRNTLAKFQITHAIHSSDTLKEDIMSESHEYSDLDDLDLIKIEDESILDSDTHGNKRKKTSKNQREVEMNQKEKTTEQHSKIVIQDIEKTNETKVIETVKNLEGSRFRLEIEDVNKKIEVGKLSESENKNEISKRSIALSKKDKNDIHLVPVDKSSQFKKDSNDIDVDKLPQFKKDGKDADADKLSVRSHQSIAISKKVDLSQDISDLECKKMHEGCEGWLDTSHLSTRIFIMNRVKISIRE